MKKIALLFSFNLIVLSIFAQINPVNNLEWDHWYVMPNNYYNLSWDNPDSSIDTLHGYKVYRDNVLYRFQDWNSVSCNESICLDDDFLLGPSFEIGVVAVYNHDSIESEPLIANCIGIYMSVPSGHEKPIFKMNSLVKAGTPLFIQAEGLQGQVSIRLLNIAGEEIGKHMFSDKQGRYSISTTGINPGMYIVEIRQKDKIKIQKLIIF